MASVGHVAVGLAAARAVRGSPPSLRAMVGWSALSLLPDADVIGFSFGVDYADPWGHRGATHSLLFAVGLGAAMALGTRRIEPAFRRTALFAIGVLASHGLLDTLTDGGLGAALLWPADPTRYFAPWRPIPVAPIGLAFLSPYGLFVSSVELLLFAPLLVYAARPSIKHPAMAALLALWLGTMWVIGSNDPVRESVIGMVVRENTAYSPGYWESAFNTIAVGQSSTQVRDRLGAPFGESWFYPAAGERGADASAAAAENCRSVRFERDVWWRPSASGPAELWVLCRAARPATSRGSSARHPRCAGNSPGVPAPVAIASGTCASAGLPWTRSSVGGDRPDGDPLGGAGMARCAIDLFWRLDVHQLHPQRSVGRQHRARAAGPGEARQPPVRPRDVLVLQHVP